jgi:hypothetical protein
MWYICKILGFHGSDYEEWRIVGCYAMWLLYVLTKATRRNIPEDTILHVVYIYLQEILVTLYADLIKAHSKRQQHSSYAFEQHSCIAQVTLIFV